LTPSPEQIREWIAEGIRRSPGREEPYTEDEIQQIVDGIAADIGNGYARLWVGQASAVVTQPVLTERIWSAGGNMEDMIAQMQRAGAHLKQAGFERLTIENTRKGWAKKLKPIGFTPFTGLDVDL